MTETDPAPSPPPETSRPEPDVPASRSDRRMGFGTAIGFQFAIVLLSLVLGHWWGLTTQTTWNQEQASLWSAHWTGRGPAVATAAGVVLALVLFAGVYSLSQFPFRWMRRMESVLNETLLPLLRGRRWWDLVLLSLLAGLGEELMFRWAIQGGLERVLQGLLQPPFAWGLAVAISALLFGLAHFVTPAYVILAGGTGLIMSLVVVAGGGLWAAILAHALYDFLALLWLIQTPPSSRL